MAGSGDDGIEFSTAALAATINNGAGKAEHGAAKKAGVAAGIGEEERDRQAGGQAAYVSAAHVDLGISSSFFPGTNLRVGNGDGGGTPKANVGSGGAAGGTPKSARVLYISPPKANVGFGMGGDNDGSGILGGGGISPSPEGTAKVGTTPKPQNNEPQTLISKARCTRLRVL